MRANKYVPRDLWLLCKLAAFRRKPVVLLHSRNDVLPMTHDAPKPCRLHRISRITARIVRRWRGYGGSLVVTESLKRLAERASDSDRVTDAR